MWLGVVTLCGTCVEARAEDLLAAVKEQTSRYAAQLAELATWCDQQGLAEQAKKTRSWLTPHDPNQLYVIILPEAVGRPPLPEGTPKNVAQWDARFTQLRRDQRV